jgi:heme oxygenase
MNSDNKFHQELSDRTSVLHKIAERSGFNMVLFQGKATRETYGKYLLHKYHIYSALEASFNKLHADENISMFQFPELKRKEAITKDLNEFLGDGWKNEAKLNSVSSYIYRINLLAKENPALLIAHAYVLYFADLSGGFIIKKILKEQYKFNENELNAYNFSEVKDVADFKKNYLSLLQKLVEKNDLQEDFIEEAKLAYMFSTLSLLELAF